jgi:hypothetical protein
LDPVTINGTSADKFWFALGRQILAEKLAGSENKIYGQTAQCRWVFDGTASDWLMFTKAFE